MEESQSKALIRINDGQVGQVSLALKNMFDNQFQDIYRNLNKTQKLFLVTEQVDKHDFTYCEIYSPTIDISDNYQKMYHCMFLGQIYFLQQPDQYLKLQKFVYLYDAFLLSMWKQDIQSSSFMTSLEDPRLFAGFPNFYFTQQFRIEERSYYIEQFNQKNDINIAQPLYFYGLSRVILVITRVIKDENNINKMLAAFTVRLDMLDNYIKLKNTKLLFCTIDGIILASNLLDTLTLQTLTKQTYIYNQTYFDFDIIDWEQMKKYISKQSFESDCSKNYNYFCRQLNGSDVQIHVTIIQEKFLLIIFNDLSFVKLYKDNINNTIEELLLEILNQTLIFCCSGVIIILISFALLTIILRPVTQIIQIIEQQIQTQIQEIDKIQQNQFIKKNIFDILKESYMNFLINFRESRNVYGQQLNKFNYPKMEVLKTDFQEILNKQFETRTHQRDSQFLNRSNSRSFQTFQESDQNSNLLNLIKALTLN